MDDILFYGSDGKKYTVSEMFLAHHIRHNYIWLAGHKINISRLIYITGQSYNIPVIYKTDRRIALTFSSTIFTLFNG